MQQLSSVVLYNANITIAIAQIFLHRNAEVHDVLFDQHFRHGTGLHVVEGECGRPLVEVPQDQDVLMP
ncbi:hypothetical protein T03_9267 [Trichinella britovi]|uniref:Uncharacterized protein n=2 Tax=Trichinella TaxID=6333 RepID=A0A0V1CCN1_TRIBR|nr:hypothetical protein T05_9784 [Trichinella murrelli]KRY47053.1 hypothetical protein T03_9267 [Trichinella britovi]